MGGSGFLVVVIANISPFFLACTVCLHAALGTSLFLSLTLAYLMNENQSFSKPYISSRLVYKQFFSDRTERYVRCRLVEDDVTRRSEPAL